jgi:hypothetical protein
MTLSYILGGLIVFAFGFVLLLAVMSGINEDEDGHD